MSQEVNTCKELENEPLINLISDDRFRNELINKINYAKETRQESQKEVSKMINVSVTKIKQIENLTCKDFNAIYKYINYLTFSRITFVD